MKITTKTIAALGFVMTVLLLAHLYQNYFAYRVSQIVDRELAEKGFATGLTAFQLLEELKDLEEFSLKFLVSDDPQYRRELTSMVSSVDENLRVLHRIHLPRAPEGEELNRILELWSSARSSIDRILRISDETTESEKAGLSREVRTLFSELQGSVRDLILASRRQIEEQVTRTRELSTQVTFMSWLSLLVAMFLIVVVCFYIYRLVSGLLETLTQTTGRIASGDFEVRLDESRGDELGELGRYLNRMSAQLGEAERIKREFISHLSHDLSAPLASMQETTRLLLDSYSDNLDRTQKRLMELNLSSSLRLSRLVDGLLDLTTLQAGVMPFDWEPLEVSGLLQSTVSDHLGLCRKKEISIDLRLPDESPVVRGDRVRLSQLFGNLLSNAIKYSPEKEVIVVEVLRPDTTETSWGRTNDRVHVTVSDRGPGVPDDEKKPIFEQFYRSEKEQRRQGNGTGLGLAISQKIAEVLGGKIWVEDNPSGGARFVVEIPTLS